VHGRPTSVCEASSSKEKTSLSYNKSDNGLIVVREAGNTAKVISEERCSQANQFRSCRDIWQYCDRQYYDWNGRRECAGASGAMPEIMSRNEAIARGRKRYFMGENCGGGVCFVASGGSWY
jgi:hypothetical protein